MTTVVFAVLGCALLVLNWLSARQLLEKNRARVIASPAMLADPAPVPSPTGAHPAAAPLEPATPTEAFADFQQTVLGHLLFRSLMLLAVFTALAALLAWWASRRSLRRLSRVTAAAQRISTGETLDERLGLTGPHDEVRELGDTFDAMLDRLDNSFTAQRRFSAHASHELRTPLTVQRTALEIPLAQGRVPADLEPAVRRALDANARSEQLIEALLMLARGESAALKPQPVDLADVARDAVADLTDEAHTGGIRIWGTVDPAPVAGDPVLLRQVALNLLANAVRHNHPDGTVQVLTGATDEVGFLEFANTGPVLDQDAIPGLFEAFRRGADNSGRGSGLGLAVVRTITLRHRGKVTAAPRPGGGLTVRVELPRRRRADQGHEPPPDALDDDRH